MSPHDITDILKKYGVKQQQIIWVCFSKYYL